MSGSQSASGIPPKLLEAAAIPQKIIDEAEAGDDIAQAILGTPARSAFLDAA